MARYPAKGVSRRLGNSVPGFNAALRDGNQFFVCGGGGSMGSTVTRKLVWPQTTVWRFHWWFHFGCIWCY
ncbi:hypothetical protein [Rhodopirellula sallentina]|nr:hypothetical protein [Rhodopirellula sallentina]